jgi:hypothetical protein
MRAEARLIAAALEAMRHRESAGRALQLLDGYDRQFPRGALRAEARLARLDALLLLRRRPEALLLLDGLPAAALQDGPRAPELRLLRGELRAEAGRCGEALGDFSVLLWPQAAAAPRASLQERALYGRASCRSRLGDAPAARADLREYLARFPDGRFSAVVRRELSR